MQPLMLSVVALLARNHDVLVPRHDVQRAPHDVLQHADFHLGPCHGDLVRPSCPWSLPW